MLPFYESQLEQAFIELLEESSWDYTPAAQLQRANMRQVLLEADLHAFLRHRYADLQLTPSEIAQITAQLAHIPATPLYAGSKQVFRLPQMRWRCGGLANPNVLILSSCHAKAA